MIKCTFLLPLHNNDGEYFPSLLLDNIRHKLVCTFGGYTMAGQNKGYYTMEGGSIVEDETQTIVVCVDDSAGVSKLRKMVADFGRVLCQESMYFEVSSAVVEFVPTESNHPPTIGEACRVAEDACVSSTWRADHADREERLPTTAPQP